MTVGTAGDARIATGFGQGSEFVGLFKTDGNEVSGGGYARVSGTWTQGSGGEANRCSNNSDLDFGTPSANWGTVDEVRLYTTATGTSDSNREFTAGITARAINSGDTFEIPAGGYEITWT